jgi:hypothetical protein
MNIILQWEWKLFEQKWKGFVWWFLGYLQTHNVLHCDTTAEVSANAYRLWWLVFTGSVVKIANFTDKKNESYSTQLYDGISVLHIG